MKYTILLLLLFSLSPVTLFAQNNYAIKGSAVDSVANAKLSNTTVVVLNAKDSIMRKFTRAGQNGSFSIDNLGKGKFILLVSYPGYADYVENFSLDSVKTTHDFGTINMRLKARILQEVLIKGAAAQIKIKGDTTEYNAAAFKIQPNSKVEDLLRQLPGIQVDKDGKITAQGETVSKVLVDGEEFFGDDPTLVTKNIRGDMVDKVQLYDKKSDQAAFTGIDDGKKTKTINIKLKDDKKNGYFGKIEGGVGTDGYRVGQVLYNRFKAKQKLSIYGIFGNDGKTGLGWQDSQKYGSSDNVQVGDDGGIYISGSGSNDDLDSFNGNYGGQGLPSAKTGGVHYDNKWDKDKQSININYKIGSLSVDGTNNTLLQNAPINSTTDQQYNNYIFRQKLDLTYKVDLDTTSTLKLSIDGTAKHSETRSKYFANTFQDTVLLNTSQRNLINNVDTKVFNASAFYTKKFKKKGRTFSWNISESYNDSHAKGNLNYQGKSYTVQGERDSVIDQNKLNDIKSSALNSNMTYTEPLSKTISLILNYGLAVSNSSADRKSYNQSSPGVYNVLDTTYSNNYRFNQLTNQQGAIFNYAKGKTTLNFGTKISEVKFNQVNEFVGRAVDNNREFKRNFINWAPQARVMYRITKSTSVSMDYRGNTNQPTIDQLQPVLINNDPLNQVLGNPRLTPSFSNSFYLNYRSYKVLADQYISINGNYSFTSNPIVSNLVIDTSRTSANPGKSTTQYVNLGNKTPFNFWTGISYGRKVPGTTLNANIGITASGSTNYSYSNNALNKINSNTYSLDFGISKYVEKKYQGYLSFSPNYTFSGSSLLPNTNNNGHGFTGYGYFSVYLPAKFQIGTDASYQYTAKTQTFGTAFSRVLLNASISKAFLKGDGLKISVKGNDLFNQNTGFNRSINGNSISQNTYTTIKRYFMLSVSWDFSQMGGGATK